MWDSFRTSKVMWRPNPEMPRGDVTPEGCLRTLMVAQLSEHRPVHSVPLTRPLNPTTAPAAPHVDLKDFPGLPPSSQEGIRGIPGTIDFPLGTTEGFGALKRPDPNTVVPRSATSKTEATSTTTTTESIPSPVVTTAAVTTTTATTTAQALPLSSGNSHWSQRSL